MSGLEFDSLVSGDIVWYRTGTFTASKAQVLSTDGAGATRRAWVEILDRAPSQVPTLEINKGRGLPVSYRSLEKA